MEAEQKQAVSNQMGDQEQAAEPKKTKITYEQYMRYSQLIVGILK